MKNFALAGNPNCGKTTLFNALTGSTAHVGNWPGVTVDKREGVYKKGAENINIVDLPGIYSLSPYTPEEVISRNYILDEKPDCVINIVDATNLERNLYLTTQIMEIDVPVVIALNMMDMLEKQGGSIDEKELSNRLGVPVVKISALRSVGLEELMEAACEVCKTERSGKTVLEQGELFHLISDVRIALKGQGIDNPLFHAIKLVESDELEVKMHPVTVGMVEEFKTSFDNELFGTDFEALVADARYKYISKHYSPLMTRRNKGVKLTKSDKIDKVLTHKWAGIPIFLVILLAIFHLTFSEDLLYLGKIFSLPPVSRRGGFGKELLACIYDGAVFSPGVMLFNIMELLTSTVSDWIVAGVEALGASGWALGLIEDGILAGMCGVLSFVPQIVFLLLLLSILEDSGYMARVAFILDRVFRKFGVSGRAFIPMIMGFGCSVPAMANTRTLADDRERVLTIRAIPFFTCGAKLPILAAITGAMAFTFNLSNVELITYGLYVIGLIVAVVTIILMRSTTQRGEISPFIMELPEYHAPSPRGLTLLVWDKTKHYVAKVFTVILASTIVIWFLSNFRWNWTMIQEADQMDQSILASLGQFMQPVFTPLGFGSQLGSIGWVFAVAAILGLIAKENVVSGFATLSAVIYASHVQTSCVVLNEITALIETTGIGWPGLIAFIVFNMTTVPCLAAVATAKSELGKGKLKWTLLFWIVTSFAASSVTYVVCTMFASWSLWSILTFAAIVVVAVVTAFALRAYNKKHPV